MGVIKKFKTSWEVQRNWQLLFPCIGLIALGYSAFRISKLFFSSNHFTAITVLSIIFFFILLKVVLFLFKKLEKRWILDYRWEMIRVFIVFALTGSSSMYIGRPLIEYIGVTKENLNPLVYWILFIIIALIFYQILLVSYGWLFGQFQFFWEFEKKMLKRLGFKRLLN